MVSDREQYLDRLREQFYFLKTSAHQFDLGLTQEAIRLGAAIRVLVHNTNQSTSLLNHLGPTGIKVMSTVPLLDPSRMPIVFDGMTVFTARGPIPKIESRYMDSTIPLAEWWNQIVFVQGEHHITRKNIVLGASNKDGGAHVDLNGYPSYRATKSFWTTYKTNPDLSRESISVDVSRNSLRTMAAELLNSQELVQLLEG